MHLKPFKVPASTPPEITILMLKALPRKLKSSYSSASSKSASLPLHPSRQRSLRRQRRKQSRHSFSTLSSASMSQPSLDLQTPLPSSISIPILSLPPVDQINNSKRLDDKNSMFNRAAEGNFSLSTEVYTPEEIAQFEEQMQQEHKGTIMTGFYRQKLDKINHWNTFYKNNGNNFFKDRHYFHREIPTLVSRYDDYVSYLMAHSKFQQSEFGQTDDDNDLNSAQLPLLSLQRTITLTDPIKIEQFTQSFTSEERAYLIEPPRTPLTLAEVGCGVGNTFFPIMEDLPLLHVNGCDVSAKAIDIIKASSQYNANAINVSVCDIGKSVLSFEDNSAEIVTLIFTLSALTPDQFHHVLTECHRILKPGGVFYIRDYAIWDLTMRRFKKGQRLSNEEPLFVRGDGTKTYFFEREKLINWMTNAGLSVNPEDVKYIKKTVENRKLEIEMERRWIFASATKVDSLQPSSECQCPSHLDVRSTSA